MPLRNVGDIMSDQTPSLVNLGNVDGRNLINVGGGGGNLISINGDVTPAQVLVGVGNCIVTDMGGGVHNINVPLPIVTFVTSINADPTPAQVLAAGAGISIVDGGGGLHTISASVPAAIVSINADTTAAQVLAAGTGITIVDFGGTHTISATAHQIAQTVSVGDAIPDSTPTAICSVTVPADGFYQVSANVKLTTNPGSGDLLIEIQDDFAVSVVASASRIFDGDALLPQVNCSTGVQAIVGPGHTFSIFVTQSSGGPMTTSADLLTSLTLLYIGV
jgi:hypothetical protein